MNHKKTLILGMCCFGLYGCDSSNDSKTLAEQSAYDPATQVIENDQHTSVFISALNMNGLDTGKIKNISFHIKTKDGNFAKPVSATYDWSYLSNNGLFDATSNSVQVPIFGLYNNYLNQLTIDIQYIDDSIYSFQKVIPAATYVDSAGIYDNVGISIKPTVTPSYSYFYLKGVLKSPIIMDVDGRVRA